MKDPLGPWLSAQGGDERRLSQETTSRLPQIRSNRGRWVPWIVGGTILVVIAVFLGLTANRSIDRAQLGDCIQYGTENGSYRREPCDAAATQLVVLAFAATSKDCVSIPGVEVATAYRRVVCLGTRGSDPADSPQAVRVGQCLEAGQDVGRRVACGTGRREVRAIKRDVLVRNDQNIELDDACNGVEGVDRVWGFDVYRTDENENASWDYVFCLASPTP